MFSLTAFGFLGSSGIGGAAEVGEGGAGGWELPKLTKGWC